MKAIVIAVVTAALLFVSGRAASAECNYAKVYVVGGGNWCPYCKSARRFLEKRGIPYEYVNVVSDFYDKAGWQRLYEAFGSRSVPIIATTRYYIATADESVIKRFLCLR
ncbi:MAG: Glutaredoxin [Candidatus Parcubacteria bacterium]|jgi:glutaredoxin